MAYIRVNQFGAAYLFGLDDASAPVIGGFKAISADVKYESEVNVKSTEGEGHTDSVTISKPEFKKGTITVRGYITDLGAFNSTPGTGFDFDDRFWIIGSTGLPRENGQLVEASVDAESFALVTGPA